MKQSLRRHYRTMRSSISPERRDIASQTIIPHTLNLLKQFPSSNIIAAYYPVHDEFNLMPCLEKLYQEGYVLSLPVTHRDTKILTFRSWSPQSIMISGYLTAIPDTDKEVLPDIVLVPLLAVDARGYRLGYGKGYYDMTLHYLKKNNPQLLALGIAYESQLSMRPLPHDQHDVKLDAILTEKRYLQISSLS